MLKKKMLLAGCHTMKFTDWTKLKVFTGKKSKAAKSMDFDLERV